MRSARDKGLGVEGQDPKTHPPAGLKTLRLSSRHESRLKTQSPPATSIFGGYFSYIYISIYIYIYIYIYTIECRQNTTKNALLQPLSYETANFIFFKKNEEKTQIVVSSPFLIKATKLPFAQKTHTSKKRQVLERLRTLHRSPTRWRSPRV